MKIKIEMAVEIEVEDFVEAATHQRRVNELFGPLKAQYDEARLRFYTPRPRRTPGLQDGPRAVRSTGYLAAYRDD